MLVPSVVGQLAPQAVFELAVTYACRAAKVAATVREQNEHLVTWLHGESLDLHDDPHVPPPGFGTEAWIPIKSAAATVSDVLGPLYDAWQITPNRFNQQIGGATPLASMLAGGLIGAGGGYLGGRLAEALLPEEYIRRGRMRQTGAVLGGLLGALPGAALGATGMSHRAATGRNPWSSWVEPNDLFGNKAASIGESARALAEELDARGLNTGRFAKQADFTGASIFMPDIPVDKFGRELWADPLTPQPMAAAASALVQAADQSRGGYGLVSPFDIARIAMGAGTGLVSATLVGQGLGALAGLTPSAQRQLQQAGMWAGIVSNIVPMAFGGR